MDNDDDQNNHNDLPDLDKSELQHMSRLDRDSVYRISALNNAVVRAKLFRDVLGEDTVETLGLAEIYYHWLKGNGEAMDAPALETQYHKHQQDQDQETE